MRRILLATGIELAVHEHGVGIPVLLLHGWGETHRSFDRLVPLLPDTLHLVVPDQRGAGESSKPGGGYSLRGAAADAVALLDALRLDTCWLVGTSSGGYVAQQVAVDRPDRVRGLVLIGSPSDLRQPLPASFVEGLSKLHEPITREDVAAINAGLALPGRVPESFLNEQTVAALTIPAHVWLATLEGLIRAVPPIESGTIRCATLLLWGGADDLLPASQAGELHRAIHGSRLVTYEGAGHLVLWEQPTRVAADMTSFIMEPPG